MLFNSLSFALFLPVIFIVYWSAGGRKRTTQNAILLLASYFFYACWDWRFLFLLMFSTLLDFFTAIRVDGSRSRTARRCWFWLSVTVNLGFLALFKYYNFFALSFTHAVAHLGLTVSPFTLNVILPVGISFYTFHGLSYVIDIYYRRIPPERNVINYALFVSFFPLLVAGPIERATHLLPQVRQPRTFSYPQAVNGLRQILWGLFKKIVIADNCSPYVNMIFGSASPTPGSAHVVAAVLFAIQIYSDFSGYSDIALGTARLFGFELLRNFAFPYFSRDMAEFWRRWHISLSGWFKDYLYIPLGGSRVDTWKKIRNVFIVFLVSGFWHGANWTYIAWGGLNACYVLPSVLTGANRSHLDTVAANRMTPTLRELAQMTVTFALTVLAWIFFRSPSVGSAVHFIRDIFSPSLFSPLPTLHLHAWFALPLLFFIAAEWMGRREQYAIARMAFTWPAPARYAFYYTLVFYIAYYSTGAPQQFIYFQF